MIMCLFAALFSFFIFNSQTFAQAIGFYAVYFTLGDGFIAPILSMLSLAAPADAKGQVMGYFVTVISCVGIAMPLVITSMFQKDFTKSGVAFTMAVNIGPPSILAAACFYIAGGYFADEIELQKQAKIECLAAAIVAVPEVALDHEGLDAELIA